ncbi:hypothetical protein ASG57_28280 [Bradyrhizobium sp. Leaf396]|nr:hypothetical protein ASG57_28280 [Bradyrhizobium sp. Leaf396]
MEMRDLTLGQGDDLYVGVNHSLEKPGDVFLVAGEPIHRFGEHDLEPTPQSVGDQRLDARAQQRRAGNCVV